MKKILLIATVFFAIFSLTNCKDKSASKKFIGKWKKNETHSTWEFSIETCSKNQFSVDSLIASSVVHGANPVKENEIDEYYQITFASGHISYGIGYTDSQGGYVILEKEGTLWISNNEAYLELVYTQHGRNGYQNKYRKDS